MNPKKWSLLGLVAVLLVFYNGAQPDIVALRTNNNFVPGTHKRERYGPSLEWLDRLMNAKKDKTRVPLDFNVLSSLMVAGLASGFKSQVANMLWMKSDEFWHSGLSTRQVPLMEAVVTLDPEFIDAWSTAGWHWAYNIYAEVQLDKKLANKPKEVRRLQERAVTTGLDYLKRGSEMNPDKYRLWMEHGWTRAEKAGIYDEETINLFRTSRSKKDARDIVRQVKNTKGELTDEVQQGMDVVGRTIGHVYEKIPEFDKALDHYGNDLLKATPQERAGLDTVGEYWHRYGPEYDIIARMYKEGDSTMKARIKGLVPDVERLVKAHEMRMLLQSRDGGSGSQPTGAYTSIAARYIPAWKLLKAGKIQEAINSTIGVMNSDPRYHLQGLPTLAKVLELRGDSPEAIKAQLAEYRNRESRSSQDIGLHFLAKIYEKAAEKAKDPKQKMAYNKLAYETWYRGRERNSLDFYARRNTFLFEDKYGFTPPQHIIKQVKDSRRDGDVNAAPTLPDYRREQHQHEEHSNEAEGSQ